MHDDVVNAGYLPTSHMYLYHINIGFPFVDNGSKFQAPIRRAPDVLFGNVERENEYSYFIAPQRNWVQQTFQHDLAPDGEGRVTVAIITPDYLAVYVSFRKDQFPNYIEWRMMGQGQYAVGIEPCTNGFGRESEHKAGRLQMLEPGEKREYDLEVGVVEGREAVAQLSRRISP
jgi:aromatic ring-cleaving dioxygenase